jgi:hypothetical protein
MRVDAWVVCLYAVIGAVLGAFGGTALSGLCAMAGASPRLRSRGPNALAAGTIVLVSVLLAGTTIGGDGDNDGVIVFVAIPAVLGVMTVIVRPIRDRSRHRAAADVVERPGGDN